MRLAHAFALAPWPLAGFCTQCIQIFSSEVVVVFSKVIFTFFVCIENKNFKWSPFRFFFVCGLILTIFCTEDPVQHAILFCLVDAILLCTGFYLHLNVLVCSTVEELVSLLSNLCSLNKKSSMIRYSFKYEFD